MPHRFIHITRHIVLKRFATNRAPLSVSIESDIPEGKIQLLINAGVVLPALCFRIGVALVNFL